ncbi:formate dehydrogenase H, selenopolypeptide subunit [Klebsiella pneumoniae]|nr:formate dehydrogenase H, selenopolypeptide subunit [Klebsiella pneumoniae]
MGEDPLQTEADLQLVRNGFDALEFVVVQDIFMTKTAEQADVILPSTSWGEHGGIFTCADRGFQRFEKAIEPQGNVKRDWRQRWDTRCLILTTKRFGMKSESCVRCFTV